MAFALGSTRFPREKEVSHSLWFLPHAEVSHSCRSQSPSLGDLIVLMTAFCQKRQIEVIITTLSIIDLSAIALVIYIFG